MKPAQRNSAIWIAIFAMGLHALWPLVAQARPKMPGMLVHICAMDGRSHFIELAPDRSPLEKRSAAQVEHCKMCVFGSDRVAVLPSAAIPALAIPAAATEGFLSSAATAPPRSLPHPPAYPRAPPAAS
jgi:hypothetical protein